MLRNRVIPVLLLRDQGLVKTEKFANPKYVGDPVNAIRIFNEKEVDELALLDIEATQNNSGPDFDLIGEVAGECFMPLAYGGGIADPRQAERLYSLGVEKVILRSAPCHDPEVVRRIAAVAGSQAVAVAVDVKRGRLGGARLHAPGTPMDGHRDWPGFIQRMVSAGAGEVILTAVDRDGTRSGMDLALIGQARVANVPLVAVGGIGSLEDIRLGVEAGADAIGVGAHFVFHGPRKAVLITYPEYDDLSRLLGNR